MLVPDRGEPTTKIGLLICSSISGFSTRNVILRLRWPQCSDRLSANPETSSSPLNRVRTRRLEICQTRECRFEIFEVFVRQVPIGHKNLEFGIKCQKRLEQILFAPKPKFIYYPV